MIPGPFIIMKTLTAILVECTFVMLLVSCASSGSGKPERGPEGTIAYHVQIEASEPDVRIEANNDYIGKAPLSLKIFGDKDGTFHNFGTDDYIIKAFPNKSGQRVQTKVFRTGRWFGREDKIPSRMYFDMNETAEGFTIDLPKSKENKP